MSYQIEQKAPCRVALTSSLPAERVAEERKRVVEAWRRNARISGFRKGKAPQSLVERRYATQIADDLQEELIRASWKEVRGEEELRAAGPLEVRRAEVRSDGAFELEGEVEVYPEVEIEDTASFTPPEFPLEPAPEEVDEALEQLRDRQAAWEPLEGVAAEDGMLVEAEVHGAPAAGGAEPFHDERSLFLLGKGEVFPEVEAAVRGASVGETVTAERIPGEEAGEQAGKRVDYRITLKSLRRKQLPELSDEFARSYGVEEGLEALRDRLRQRLRFERARGRRNAWRDALVQHLAGGRAIPLPERIVKERTQRELVDFAQTLAQRGMDLKEAQLDWNKIESEVQERVQRTLRAELTLDALAESEGIVVSDEELDAELEKQAHIGGVPFAELKGNLAKQGELDAVRAVLRRERAVDGILARFPAEEEPAAPSEGAEP